MDPCVIVFQVMRRIPSGAMRGWRMAMGMPIPLSLSHRRSEPSLINDIPVLIDGATDSKVTIGEHFQRSSVLSCVDFGSRMVAKSIVQCVDFSPISVRGPQVVTCGVPLVAARLLRALARAP